MAQCTVAQYGRVLERSRFVRNPGHSARDSFFEPNDFVKCLDGTWQPRELALEPAPSEEWSQVRDFPEVDLKLLQKRHWSVLISQPWQFSQDILLGEARALLRSLQVLVSVHRVRDRRILCLSGNMSCVLAFERRRARNFRLLVQIRKLTAICLCHNIRFHVRWIASESNCSDDPSRRFSNANATQASSSDLTDNIFNSLVARSCSTTSHGAEDSLLGGSSPAPSTCVERCSGGACTCPAPACAACSEFAESCDDWSDDEEAALVGRSGSPSDSEPCGQPSSAPRAEGGELAGEEAVPNCPGAAAPGSPRPRDESSHDHWVNFDEGLASDATTSDEEMGPTMPRPRRKSSVVARRTSMIQAADTGHLSFLEWSAVKEAPRYDRALSEFLKHPLTLEQRLVEDAEVDGALVRFFNERYRLGDSASTGDVLLAALCHAFPEFGIHGSRALPRSRRALKGWRRRTPPRSRDPHAWAIWCLVIIEMILLGYWSMAVYTLWLVTCYFRPGEPLTIQRRDIQAPVPGVSARYQIILFPEERPSRSKTYAANDTVELWCPWCESLPATAAALKTGPETDHVFRFTYPQYLVVWHKALKRLRLLDYVMKLVPYMARHSGPSIDAARSLRTRREIKDRGRWASDRSVLRYEQRARLARSFNRLPAGLQAHALKCEQNLDAVVLGRISAEDLGPAPRG